MAAGKRGGYRDDKFRSCDLDFEVSRRRTSYSRSECDRIRNGDRTCEKIQGRGGVLKDRVGVRQKDIKERKFVNGGYLSASSRSDSGCSASSRVPKSCGFPAKDVDREPGEWSGESLYGEAIDSGVGIKDFETLESKRHGSSPVESKKRKFSPIVWDREDQDVSNMGRAMSYSPVGTNLPSLPPLPKSYGSSPNLVPDGEVQVSPSNDFDEHMSEPSQAKPFEDLGICEPDVSNSISQLDISSSPPQLQQRDTSQVMEQVEGEDFIPTRHISASRWAGDANSPADEGEIFDDENMPRKRNQISEGTQTVQITSLTPEHWELEDGDHQEARARSFGSDGGSYRCSSNRDDSDTNECVEMDDGLDRNGASVSLTDSETDDDHSSAGTSQLVVPPQRSFNMLQGCRSVDEFERLNKINEGTYGIVYRAKDKRTGEIVALKKVKMEKEREGFPLTSLREINILLSFDHPFIVDVKEVVVGSSLDSIFMVMEYMEHDLKGLMETMKQPFSQSEVKCLMLQLLEGVKYLHDNWVLHRDLKTSNLLLNNRGELKICDFGLARQYGSPLKPYTHLVVTLWYRSPELLLGAKEYSTAVDMWSLGCIMAEMLSKQPLFNGKAEFDQLDKIFRILGTPNEILWPGFSKLPGVKGNFVKHQCNLLRKKFPATSFTGSPVLSDAGFDLLNRLLTYDPEKRITAEEALKHEWFREVPLPKSKEFMPTFPDQHAQDRKVRRLMKSPHPLEEQCQKELKQKELGTCGLFG